MRRPAWLVGLILAVGVAGTAVALAGREADTQFVVVQQGLTPVRAAQLDRLVATTEDPRPFHHGRARGAQCVSSGAGALGNPWSCVVRYPRLPRVRYRVVVRADRSIRGVAVLAHSTRATASGRLVLSSRGGELVVKGCCVAVGP